MRGAILGSLGLALLLLAPTAGAHLGPVTVEGDAVPEPPEAVCVPVCNVFMTQLANAPQLVVVESGGTVTWEATIGPSHTATSDDVPEDKQTTILDNRPTDPTDRCLHVFVADTAQAQFRIANGSLQALNPASTDGWRTCEEAIPLGSVGSAGFLLSYHCNVHPSFQHAGIVVVPDAA